MTAVISHRMEDGSKRAIGLCMQNTQHAEKNYSQKEGMHGHCLCGEDISLVIVGTEV